MKLSEWLWEKYRDENLTFAELVIATRVHHGLVVDEMYVGYALKFPIYTRPHGYTDPELKKNG